MPFPQTERFMYTIRYLSILLMLSCFCMASWGQDDTFDPDSPSEPGVPLLKSQLILVAQPSEGGSVSGGGVKLEGTSCKVSASASSGYVFSHWADANGDTLSTARSYTHVKGPKSESLTAYFTFQPGGPAEPSEPSQILYYRLATQATVGGTVSGGGRYQQGTSVTVHANAEAGFVFVNWTDSNGDTLSTEATYKYTMDTHHDTLTAHFLFDPSSPNEPSDPILYKRVTVSGGEGGTVSGGGRILQGNSTTLTARANSGYTFGGWYLNGELYTQLPSFSYTVGDDYADFYAYFLFDPSSPSEPLQPALDKYAFYLMTVNATPGTEMQYPLYLTSTQGLKDITFNLTFPTAMMPTLENIEVSEHAVGYTTSLSAVNDSVFIFTMIGGTTAAVDATKLLNFKVQVSDSIVPGSSWPVKINQISLVQEDGTSVTARTRNGRMGVYEWGDASMDGEVDVTDSRLVTDDFLEVGKEELDMNISDIINDGTLDVLDIRAIIEKWLRIFFPEPQQAKRKECQKVM